MSQLNSELDRIANTTQFNGAKLLDGNYTGHLPGRRQRGRDDQRRSRSPAGHGCRRPRRGRRRRHDRARAALSRATVTADRRRHRRRHGHHRLATDCRLRGHDGAQRHDHRRRQVAWTCRRIVRGRHQATSTRPAQARRQPLDGDLRCRRSVTGHVGHRHRSPCTGQRHGCRHHRPPRSRPRPRLQPSRRCVGRDHHDRQRHQDRLDHSRRPRCAAEPVRAHHQQPQRRGREPVRVREPIRDTDMARRWCSFTRTRSCRRPAPRCSRRPTGTAGVLQLLRG